MRSFVDAVARPCEVFITYMVTVTVGGAALSAALTPQKRGPCPQLSGRQGRLPSSLARPRRGFLATPRACYRNFLDTALRRLT